MDGRNPTPGPMAVAAARWWGVPVTIVALTLLNLGLGAAFAGSWELRVCAEPANLPFSNRQGEGFENEIAEILADQLGADLSYEWLPRPSSRHRDEYLRTGRCDLVMGISDGHDGFLTTIAYYRSSYVFVYPSDASFDIDSLDDPLLRGLRIAVTGGGRVGPERLGLAARGLVENQVAFEPDHSRPDPYSTPIEAVAEGRADLAITWGPVAGYAASRTEVPLELVPVTPQIGQTFLPMVIPIALGVRPRDEALRDRLNHALASRWPEIEAVLGSYGIPLEPLPEPSIAGSADQRLRIGAVLPLPTGPVPLDPEAPEAAAEAAFRGAVLAGEAAQRSAQLDPDLFEVVIASAPSAQAARRAAARLATADGAFALVGGLGEGQAEALGRVAVEQGILFLNIGAMAATLPSAARNTTFHIESSPQAYLRAITRGAADTGVESWFLVYPAIDGSLESTARQVIQALPGTTIEGSRAVTGSSEYMSAIEAIRTARPDAVLLLLDWREQLEFLGLYDAFELEPLLTGIPYPMTQTRSFYLALQDASPGVNALERVALWDPASRAAGAEELAASYLGRWGEPMDAPAWAAYQAVSILGQALAAVPSADTDQLIGYLESDEAAFDVAKGEPARFDPESHRLLQSLYQVRIVRGAEELTDLATVTRVFER